MCGSAATTPIAHALQPSAEVTYASRNGKFGIVGFSIGTLKHASIVQYLSERSSSLFRKTFTYARCSAARLLARAAGTRKGEGG